MLAKRVKALLLLMVTSFVLMGAGYENLIVKEIFIEGNRKIEDQAIIYKLQTKIGNPFRSQNIEEDIKAIYNIGYFEEIKVDVKENDDGLTITYILTERPLIKKISFSGNKKLRTETLNEQINISAGGIYNPFLIEKNTQNLTQYYKNEGYYLAQIESRTEKMGKEWIELIFEIKEGKKIKIRGIKIEGNKQYSDKEIKKLIETQKHWFFSFITSSGYLKKETLSQDIFKIENFYFNNGFIHATVKEPDIFFDPEKEGLFISIDIQEGDQYRSGEIAIKGNSIIASDRIRKYMTISEDEVFNREILRSDISTIQNLYAEKGYVFTQVVPITQEKRNEKKINVTLDIEEGELTYIDKINIVGNIKTRDKVIRREVRLKEGEIFNSRKIRYSYNNITNLGFFETVDIQPNTNPDKNTVDLDIKVKERMSGQMSVGGGYSSAEQFIWTAEVKQGNLFGRGQKLSVSTEKSNERFTYNLGFTEPWLFDIPLSAGFDFYYLERIYDDYDKTSRGGDLQLGYPVASFTKLYGTYLIENVDIKITKNDPAEVSAGLLEAEGRSSTRSLRLSLIRDNRDNRFKPSGGSRNQLTFETAGGLFGGSNEFFKIIADSGWHFPVWKKLILSLHGKIGYVRGLRDEPPPIFENFYCGGLSTVRGYDERGIGPSDGGNKTVLTNVELAFPIYDMIRGILFYDAGMVYEFGDKFFKKSLKEGAGVGVRFFTPIGPLRLDYGIPLNPEPGDDKQAKWHFAIGTYF